MDAASRPACPAAVANDRWKLPRRPAEVLGPLHAPKLERSVHLKYAHGDDDARADSVYAVVGRRQQQFHCGVDDEPIHDDAQVGEVRLGACRVGDLLQRGNDAIMSDQGDKMTTEARLLENILINVKLM